MRGKNIVPSFSKLSFAILENNKITPKTLNYINFCLLYHTYLPTSSTAAFPLSNLNFQRFCRHFRQNSFTAHTVVRETLPPTVFLIKIVKLTSEQN